MPACFKCGSELIEYNQKNPGEDPDGEYYYCNVCVSSTRKCPVCKKGELVRYLEFVDDVEGYEGQLVDTECIKCVFCGYGE